MKDFFQKIFEADFMPHGHCYFWKPEILWLNVGGDALIVLAYFSIPPMLFYFANRRKDLVHKSVFILFGLFILACGLTHLMHIWTVWVPSYRLEGVVKIITGVLSVFTAVLLYKSIPSLLALPSHNTLEDANLELQREIKERETAQQALRHANEVLESRVQQRTGMLMGTNRELEHEIEIRKKTEQELKLKNEELSRINNDLDTFVYSASHDLKEPIVNISSLLKMLREELPQITPMAEEVLDRLQQTVGQVQHTITDLTDVSRTQRILQQEELEPVPVEPVLEEVKDTLQSLIEESNARIETDFSACHAVWFAQKNLRSVLFNLLSNALKYRSTERVPCIDIYTRSEGKYDVLYVQDNGLGIDLQQHGQKLFTLFRRLHDHVEGSGVGLFIVKRLIENYNGKIEVESQPGIGTTFKVFFPKYKLTSRKTHEKTERNTVD